MWAAGEITRQSWLTAQRELDRQHEDLGRALLAQPPALRLVEDVSQVVATLAR